MRIIIEPTETPTTEIERAVPHHRVVIEHPYDDIDIIELGEMLRAALLAKGYHPDNVNDLFGE